MADTKIEWCDKVWNPARGCSHNCRYCYAHRIHNRHLPGHPVGPFSRVVFLPERLEMPLRWRKPCRVFVDSMFDLWDKQIPNKFIDKMCAVMALCPQHTFVVLTKQARRMREYFSDIGRVGEQVAGEIWDFYEADKNRKVNCPPLSRFPLKNVIFGVSVTTQPEADALIPLLLETPAVVRCVSVEPMLGPVNLRGLPRPKGVRFDALLDHTLDGRSSAHLNWVICGGQTGPGATPMHPDWVRSLRDQCQAAGVPFFFKSWGEWLPGQNEKHPNPPPGANSIVAHHQDGTWGAREVRNMAKNYVMWSPDGEIHRGDARTGANYFEVKAWAERVGKKAAGCLLDGKEWKQLPEITRG